MEQNTPQLLTEAEWFGMLSRDTIDEIIVLLRERGLIAEPVDPDLIEAEALHSDWLLGKIGGPGGSFHLALAALRRGRELAKPLTREMVRDALHAAGVFYLADTVIDKVYAALVEQMK